MKYYESDFYSGILLSCYLNPSYNPACLACADRKECYGKEKYYPYRDKARTLSRLLNEYDCLALDQVDRLAKLMGIEDKNKIYSILNGNACFDGKLNRIVKLSLGITI
ncbi:MAG: hypothetical protein ABFD08_05825 [Syntrophomonas sp.]